MTDPNGESTREFASSFKRFIDAMNAEAAKETSPLLDRLRAHLGGEPGRLAFRLYWQPALWATVAFAALFHLIGACMRRPGVVAKQEVILSGPGESLTFTHDTVEPAKAYAPGIRLALPFALHAEGVVVGLENMIDIGIRS